MMGGAADFPERASSPLKRRASSMEPDSIEQDANEDVDMITAPTSDTVDTSKSEQSEKVDTAESSCSITDEPKNEMVREDGEPMDISPSGMCATDTNWIHEVDRPIKGCKFPVSIEAHVKAIRTLLKDQYSSPLKDGQECYLVSKSWLAKVPDEQSPKHTVEDLAAIPPVDNSDIIQEIIEDPCVGSTIDPLKKQFVCLKPKYDSEQFEAFPPAAWDLLMQWPGLKEGQLPIRREAHATKEDGTEIRWEWHPPILSIHRLWSAMSVHPVEASMKANNPGPMRLVRSASTSFQTFLKQAKMLSGIALETRVRVWTVPQPPTGAQAWKHLVDVETFLALEKNSERELIDLSDRTNQSDTKSVKTLNFFGILQPQAIVLDLNETGTNWTSNSVSAQARTSLPSRNTSSSAIVNRNSKSGRSSPVLQGPLTRGRSQKSGRVPGCVGLTNLGNSCYMNAALQCVRNVEELTKYFLSGEWERELNRENVLSHNGDVAAAYAQLLKEVYKDPSPGCVSPRQFKTTIGKYSTGFSGYGQQDSQEFLGFLLDGLQEDLSRIKKKPYIEKPDSTDEMVNDADAIRQMAEKVWDITKKRDDSVIADLFTGLYKSTLVCPECGKVSITFDPFNNLTLPLPVSTKWTHTVKFFPLNDRPIDIKVELDKHASIKSLKQFISVRTGVSVDRLFGAEEWKGRFYKHYTDFSCASDDIGGSDNAWFFELEAKPTNLGAKSQKQQKLGEAVRSMVDEGEQNPSMPWDNEEAESLLVPILHRRPTTGKNNYSSAKWTTACAPHFIVVTPEEARSEDAIRRKILEKVATFTRGSFFSRVEEADSSDTTEPEMIGPGGSDEGSSNEVIAQSVKGEDDMVDVQMKDANNARRYVVQVSEP